MAVNYNPVTFCFDVTAATHTFADLVAAKGGAIAAGDMIHIPASGFFSISDRSRSDSEFSCAISAKVGQGPPARTGSMVDFLTPFSFAVNLGITNLPVSIQAHERCWTRVILGCYRPKNCIPFSSQFFSKFHFHSNCYILGHWIVVLMQFRHEFNPITVSIST